MFSRPVTCTHESEIFHGEWIEGENWPYFTCGCAAVPMRIYKYADPNHEDNLRSPGLPRMFNFKACLRDMIVRLEVSYAVFKYRYHVSSPYQYGVCCKQCFKRSPNEFELKDGFVWYKDHTVMDTYMSHAKFANFVRWHIRPDRYTDLDDVQFLFRATGGSAQKDLPLHSYDLNRFEIDTDTYDQGEIMIPHYDRPAHLLYMYERNENWAMEVVNPPPAYRSFGLDVFTCRGKVYYRETNCLFCAQSVFRINNVGRYDDQDRITWDVLWGTGPFEWWEVNDIRATPAVLPRDQTQVNPDDYIDDLIATMDI